MYINKVYTEVGSRVKLSPLRRMTLPYTISNLRWLNSRSLIILDTQEKLHLLDVRAQDNLETLDMSRVGISYASSHFKGLSTGGNVSKVRTMVRNMPMIEGRKFYVRNVLYDIYYPLQAMALAGERACYNTVVVFGTQLLLLGTKSLHAICIRTWTERIQHLIVQVSFKQRTVLSQTQTQTQTQTRYLI